MIPMLSMGTSAAESGPPATPRATALLVTAALAPVGNVENFYSGLPITVDLYQSLVKKLINSTT